MTYDITKEGFRVAPTRDERVYEAAELFAHGKSGNDAFAQARLLEAFSTSDFPVLLADAFTKQAIATQQNQVREFEPILTDVRTDTFDRRKLVDLWSGDAFETVLEGEEYKGGTLSETELDHGAGKHGKSYGLTWELRRSRRFSDLANFPRLLANGSIKGQNNAVTKLLAGTNTWNTAFFGTIATTPFNETNLDAALKELAQREDHRGDLVDTSNLVLIFGPALRTEVNRILNATELEIQETSGTRVTKTRVPNPFRGLVTPLESRAIAKALGTAGPTGWALVQGNNSTLPSIIRTLLTGEEDLDIRVKDDAGTRPGGGDVGFENGSFNDDTIWFRGRDVYGIDPGFTTGVWASKGA